MDKIWLNKEGNQQCILFFNGWGMDRQAVSHLGAENFDVCMLNDYNPVSVIMEPLGQYQSVYVVAWSLGVWASARALNGSSRKITKAIAINGTPEPISNTFGIAPEIFNTTRESWNSSNRTKFNIRMAGGRKMYNEIADRMPLREVENQKSELEYIQRVNGHGGPSPIQFDCAIIGNGDLIFSPSNQLNYWAPRIRTVKSDVPHYPFTMFESWSQIIQL